MNNKRKFCFHKPCRILGIAGFVIMFNVYFPLSYLTGLMNSVILFIAVALIRLASYGCMLLLVYYAIASLRQLLRNEDPNKLNRMLIIVYVGIILCIAFMPNRKPWYVRQTSGLRERMQQKADIKAIQDWLLTLGPTEDPDSFVVLSHYMMIGGENLPKFIKDIDPVSFHVKKYDSINYAYFIWGAGHLGTWGFIVGPSDSEVPLSSDGKYILSVDKGTLVWVDNK